MLEDKKYGEWKEKRKANFVQDIVHDKICLGNDALASENKKINKEIE